VKEEEMKENKAIDNHSMAWAREISEMAVLSPDENVA